MKQEITLLLERRWLISHSDLLLLPAELKGLVQLLLYVLADIICCLSFFFFFVHSVMRGYYILYINVKKC